MNNTAHTTSINPLNQNIEDSKINMTISSRQLSTSESKNNTGLRNFIKSRKILVFSSFVQANFVAILIIRYYKLNFFILIKLAMNNSSQSTFINSLDCNIEDSKINMTISSRQFSTNETQNNSGL